MTYGDYPKTIRAFAGNRLPKFTAEETASLQKSYDFLGVNYYTGFFAANIMSSNNVNVSMTTDNHANLTCKLKTCSLINLSLICVHKPVCFPSQR